MQALRVEHIMHDDALAVNDTTPFAAIVGQFLKEPYSNLYVVNSAGKFLGAIRLHSLKEMLDQADSLAAVIAHDLVDESFAFVTPSQNLADTMEIFWRETAERLPVVDNRQDRKLIGWISKRDLFGVYSQEILRKRQLLGRFVVRDADGPRDVFVELPEGIELRTVELPPHWEGRTLAELAPRSRHHVHVLAIKRRDPLTGHQLTEMPGAGTRLTRGDDLVVIGTAENITQFMGALAPGVENGKM
jgi:CBS domain-containing protein